MKVSNNKTNGIMISMIFAISILTNLNAQHMGQGNNMGHNMDQNTMQHMGQQMMNMQQMMNNLEGMMDRTSGMMDAMHDINQMGNNSSGDHNHGNFDDIGGNGGMMEMMHSMDQITKDMQGFMSQMDIMMKNGEMMNDPLMNEYMENMQEHMGTVMNGYDGVITELEKIQILNTN